MHFFTINLHRLDSRLVFCIMSFFASKKFILFGLIFVLLAAIPVTIWLVGQQTRPATQAIKATKLFFSPETTSTTVGETFDLAVTVDPGVNQISFVKLAVNYDSTKLATSGAGFSPNTSALPGILEGPIYTPGKISITLTVKADPTSVIQTQTQVGTITFEALEETGATPAQITFDTLDNQTQVLSIASADLPSENVLSSTSPASVIIGASTVSPTASPTPTTAATTTPTPTTTGTPTPTPTPGAGGTNQAPACTALNVDRATTGDAPFAITFTAVGSDTDGTISKATFNFGDGPVEDVTQSGGIGTNTVSVQTSHTYTTAGTYTATAVLTDNSSNVSSATTCTQTITVTSTATPTPTPFIPAPTIEPSGPGDIILGIGTIGVILVILGAFTLLAL